MSFCTTSPILYVNVSFSTHDQKSKFESMAMLCRQGRVGSIFSFHSGTTMRAGKGTSLTGTLLIVTIVFLAKYFFIALRPNK